jgi:hypothetical protein
LNAAISSLHDHELVAGHEQVQLARIALFEVDEDRRLADRE